ncbi:hypothetical protein PV11_03466 [Exophiala sideris]|uniref:Uncharacterized protein n=1 Tax=Exophiala sideris TaxID=1016849 RepID=A0A0D1YJT7_9EURO|nr:hypothetical protein PV11_03466 [Exophiala sideris]
MSSLRDRGVLPDLGNGNVSQQYPSNYRNHLPSRTNELQDGNAELSEVAMPQPAEPESTSRKNTSLENEHDQAQNGELSEVVMPQPAEPESAYRKIISLENEEDQAQNTRLRVQEHRGQLESTRIPLHTAETSPRRCSGGSHSLCSHSVTNDVDHITEGVGGSQEKEMPLQQRRILLRRATEIYIVAHLIFFSILGTLARLGLEAITQYPRAPVLTPVLWANVGGTYHRLPGRRPSSFQGRVGQAYRRMVV